MKLWAVVLAGAALSCGGNSTAAAPEAAAGAAGAGGQARPAQCVSATDKGNELGYGAPCTPHGGECTAMSPPSFCLADAGQSEWFCSRVGCKIDSDCGMATVCHFEPGGSACVPAKCGVSGSGNGGTGGAAGTGGTGGTGGNGTGGTGG